MEGWNVRFVQSLMFQLRRGLGFGVATKVQELNSLQESAGAEKQKIECLNSMRPNVLGNGG